eukprot:gene11305-biopygen12834
MRMARCHSTTTRMTGGEQWLRRRRRRLGGRGGISLCRRLAEEQPLLGDVGQADAVLALLPAVVRLPEPVEVLLGQARLDVVAFLEVALARHAVLELGEVGQLAAGLHITQVARREPHGQRRGLGALVAPVGAAARAQHVLAQRLLELGRDRGWAVRERLGRAARAVVDQGEGDGHAGGEGEKHEGGEPPGEALGHGLEHIARWLADERSSAAD